MDDREVARQLIEKVTCKPDGTYRGYYHPSFGLPHLTTPRKQILADNRLEALLSYCDPTKRFFIGGANAGYQCFHIASRGGTVVAVEREKKTYQHSLLVARYNGFGIDNPLLLNGNIEDFLEKNTRKFDYGFLLQVFHHMWKTSEETAFKALNRLAACAPVIIMQVRPKPWTPPKQELPDYILKHSILKRYVNISPAKPYLHGSCVLYAFHR